jgi:hypothetical protein
MKQRSIGFMFLLCWITLPSYAIGSELSLIPEGVEMIVWEHQNWETNGGFERLTIWNDGRSEVVVAPLRYASGGQENLQPKSGWEKVNRENPPHVEFVRKDIFPPEVARAKFKEALAAGIHLLESFKPGYVDGNGTRVVIQTKGRLMETVIPMFLDADKGTLNHKRFLAVSEVLGGFDRNAYEVVPK